MRPIRESEFVDAGAAIQDCWNAIGVHGDQSCPELPRHSHCRNCPAYSTAAAMLLDRPMPAESAREWAEHYARDKPGREARTSSAILFRLGEEWFALSTLSLDEVVGPRPIHSLPHGRGAMVLGLTNVRGELLVCVSMAQLLGVAAGDGPEGRLIVVQHDNGRLVFPVDEVQHSHRYHADALEPLPATVARSPSSFARGLLRFDGRMVAVLDDGLVLSALDRGLR